MPGRFDVFAPMFQQMTEKEFKEQVLIHARRLYAVAMGVLSDSDLAGDCVQEVYAKLWEKRERLQEVENIEAYCVTSVRRVAVDICRRRGRESLSEGYTEFEGMADDRDTERLLDDRESLREVERLLESLPEGQRSVVRMTGISGMSNSEIVEATGLSAENVRALLCRGRKRLRELMTGKDKRR